MELPHPLRVSLARAPSLFHPLLPSACYAGYHNTRASNNSLRNTKKREIQHFKAIISTTREQRLQNSILFSPSLFVWYHLFSKNSPLSLSSFRQITSSGIIFLSIMDVNCSRVLGKLSNTYPPALGRKQIIKTTYASQMDDFMNS